MGLWIDRYRGAVEQGNKYREEKMIVIVIVIVIVRVGQRWRELDG